MKYNGIAKILQLAICAIMFLLPGCGGGTSGTGGTGSTEFRGVISSRDNAPVVNATVILEQSDDITATDANGAWQIITQYESADVTLRIETATTQVRTQIKDLPEGPKEVDLRLQIDDKKQEVEVTEQKVREKPKPTPTTVPGIPTATDTAVVVPTHTATPLPTSVPTTVAPATPTATPTPETVFRGLMQSSNPALLTGRIRIVQGPGRKINDKGRFVFRAPPSVNNKRFAYILGERRGTVTIDAITEQTSEAKLTLQVEEGNGTKLVLSVNSVEIKRFP